ncbi:hypothetical protein AV530_019623 [Patagioenas fasciata monilis]|uniref:Uncharacterized protein n=1 Tax=Patagioenas fasciata monilis TaxID=372326 RepID=A0A1V4JEM0_PATFA|nr:hypothetical protein AV530_019623 [Patagioenas fasciata monilis]
MEKPDHPPGIEPNAAPRELSCILERWHKQFRTRTVNICFCIEQEGQKKNSFLPAAAGLLQQDGNSLLLLY